MQAVNAAIFAGMKPLFCDVNLNDFTMNVRSLKKILDKYKNVEMIVPTHIFGNSCDLDKIIKIIRKREIFVLEDAAQSLGSKINGKKTRTGSTNGNNFNFVLLSLKNKIMLNKIKDIKPLTADNLIKKIITIIINQRYNGYVSLLSHR